MRSTEQPVTHEMPQPLGILAGEQRERAREYLEAFERLLNTPEPRPLYAMYFLVTHAIELLLKAYLTAHAVPKKRLRDVAVRHNLPALLDLCEEKHLPAVIDLREYVSTLQEMNKDYDFRYVTGYNLHLPPPAACLAIARALESAVAPTVTEAQMKATLDFAVETRHLKGKKSDGPTDRARGTNGMKRDLDLIREIMLALENSPQLNGRASWEGYASEFAKLEGHDDDELAYHMMLIIDEGWIEGEYWRTSGKFALTRITADGHDFLDSTRQPDIWAKAKSIAKSRGAETLRFAWDIAKSIVNAEITRHIGQIT
ncbi:DUF2513 domain-containing protein [Bradyrhizobium australiense]|uniref:DUF2513 domain-containing protein n=1 Tax=Bradyrhizobium australiense TaxID=2721161 RepID=A0A7Y4LWG0_9BRAD|nr:DUF2513 domain-containing protein [Bradyrhizobium australiense]NOJ41383.1 DUF2513 domain-containing protein [Bradyrhizobium australiense]